MPAKNKEEWISYNRDWSETRYSPLDQINATNVSKLGLAWSLDIPNVGSGTRQEATNLVSNGVLYSITPFSLVYAVDARTGKILWQSDPETNRAASACCGVVNRGLALYEGKVIAPVLDGRLRALDMQTGKVLWESRVTPTNLPYTITMAPRVIKGGRVIVGASGGEYAVRGFFAAYRREHRKGTVEVLYGSRRPVQTIRTTHLRRVGQDLGRIQEVVGCRWRRSRLGRRRL